MQTCMTHAYTCIHARIHIPHTYIIHANTHATIYAAHKHTCRHNTHICTISTHDIHNIHMLHACRHSIQPGVVMPRREPAQEQSPNRGRQSQGLERPLLSLRTQGPALFCHGCPYMPLFLGRFEPACCPCCLLNQKSSGEHGCPGPSPHLQWSLCQWPG